MLLHYYDTTPTGSDTTAPIVALVGSPSVARMSRVAGKDTVTATWEADEDTTTWQARLVPSGASPVAAGTLIESGGATPAGQDVAVTITDDEIVAAGGAEGVQTIKFFSQDAAGNWSS